MKHKKIRTIIISIFEDGSSDIQVEEHKSYIHLSNMRKILLLKVHVQVHHG